MAIWHALRGAGELAMGLPVVVPSRGWNDHRLLSVNPLGWPIKEMDMRCLARDPKGPAGWLGERAVEGGD